MSTDDFTKAFETWAAARKIGFSGGDREETIGASEIGKCARMVGYKKHKVPADEGYVESGGFAIRGDVMEDHAIVPIVRTWVETIHDGELLWAGQAEQMRIVDKKRYASATPDGLAVDMPRDCLRAYGVRDIGESLCVYLEFKSLDPRVSEGKLPKPEHVAQVNYAMGLVRRTKMADGNKYLPDYGVIIYVDASDYSSIKVFPTKYDHDVFKFQLGKAKAIMEVDNPELLRPEGKIEGGGDCRYCAHSQRCLGYAAMVPKAVQEVDDETRADIVAKAREIVALSADIEELKLDKSRAEADLKEMLAEARTKFLDHGGVKVSWSSVKERETWDNDGIRKAAVAAGIDVTEYKKTGKPSDRLEVKALASVDS